MYSFFVLFFFFNDTATTEIYTLSLHDALPISLELALDDRRIDCAARVVDDRVGEQADRARLHIHLDDGGLCAEGDRKSTRLNSSHDQISYAVFCLKKKKKQKQIR